MRGERERWAERRLRDQLAILHRNISGEFAEVIVAGIRADVREGRHICVDRRTPQAPCRSSRRVTFRRAAIVAPPIHVERSSSDDPVDRIDIGVDARRINEIVLGKRSVTADSALRLSRFFGNSPHFWLGLQTQYDLDITQDRLGKRLDREVRPLAMAG